MSDEAQGGAARKRTARRERGDAAERLAAAHLTANGLEILLRNYLRRSGELDIVARDGDVLVIVEVRMRASAAFGGAAASVGGRKRARIVRTAQQLLQQRRDLSQLRVRFDVVLVTAPPGAAPRVEWIRHAFSS